MAAFDPHPLRCLALCARPATDDALRRQLAEAAAAVRRWDLVVAAAEYHGVAGLLHAHLKAAAVGLPEPARRSLAALTARQRHATGVRLRVLGQVLDLFERRQIRTLVLKGAALATTVYRHPGDRPFADLDLWVEPERAQEALACLLQEGFASHPAHGLPEHRHLAPVSRELEGVRVIVELHYRVVVAGPDAFAPVLERSSKLQIDGRSARTLGPADTLAHLHHHLVYHLVFHRGLRLKWVADLLGVAEHYARVIDWSRLRRQYPAMPGALAMLHPLSPVSDGLRTSSAVSLPRRVPPGADAELSVLPAPERSAAGDRPGDPLDRPDWLSPDSRRSLADTLWPSAWRLRLFWGLDGSAALLLYRCRYLGRVLAFAAEIWKSHGGSLATLSRRPWLRSRWPPRPRRDS